MRSGSTRWDWLVWFGLFVVIGALWAVATPRFASPDEPAHVRKAAGTVRLQGIGEQVPGQPAWLRTFEIPDAYVEPDPGCFAFDPTITAACATLPPLTRENVAAATSASRYPPVYYVVTGAPTLVIDSYKGVYAMRFASAALSAAAVASAFALAARSRSPKWLRAGVLVAVTPMVAFLAAMVNPNGAEISFFLAGWVALLVAIERSEYGGRPPWFAAAALFAVGVLMRQLGVVWLLAGAVVTGALVGLPALRRILGDTRFRIAAAVLAAAAVLQFAWLAAANSLGAVNDPRIAIDAPSDTIIGDVLNASMGNVREMIGRLGWSDVPMPTITELVWVIGLGGLIVAALVLSSRRHAIGLATALVATWGIPFVLEVKDARVTGYYWQGRYTLPLAVLVPILATWVLGRASNDRFPGRLSACIAVGVVVGHVAAFHQALRRYMVGLDGPVSLRDPEWEPALPAWLLIVAYGAVWSVVCWRALAPTPSLSVGRVLDVQGERADEQLDADQERCDPEDRGAR
ncbi:MAG: DUF2142 domain-containing protein [Acidimicrobiia bacterium]